MKKIFSIVFAGLLSILAISCAKDEKAVFKASESVAPVLGNVTVGKKITVAYTPAVFKMNFNDSMATYHTLGLVKIDSTKSGMTLKAAKDDPKNNVLTITTDALTSVLRAKGYEFGQTVKLAIVVRASIQDPAKGVTNGYVDSEESYEFELKLKKPSGGAYAAFTETSPWGVIGKIASTGNDWKNDEEMATDGTWHVCEGIELATTDQFKFRKEKDWGTNFGAGPEISTEPYVVTIGEELPAGANGKNLAVPEDGVYDLLLNPEAGVYKIVVHVADPYAEYTDDSTWGVIGKIASTGNDWKNDEDMTTNGTWHVCRGLELVTTDQFKFRKDKDWGTNFGAGPEISTEPYVVTIGEELPAGPNGKNLAVPEDGTYDLLLNPEAAVYKIVKAQ